MAPETRQNSKNKIIPQKNHLCLYFEYYLLSTLFPALLFSKLSLNWLILSLRFNNLGVLLPPSESLEVCLLMLFSSDSLNLDTKLPMLEFKPASLEDFFAIKGVFSMDLGLWVLLVVWACLKRPLRSRRLRPSAKRAENYKKNKKNLKFRKLIAKEECICCFVYLN